MIQYARGEIRSEMLSPRPEVFDMRSGSARDVPAAAEVLRANLIVERARSRISQQQLAERSGVSRPTISRIERAAGDISLDVIERLARALGVSVHLLFTPPPDDPPSRAELERRATAPDSEFVDADAFDAALDEAEGRTSRRSSATRRSRLDR